VPKTSNYPGIDAWIPGIGAFQMTVAKRHSINGRAVEDLEMLDKPLYWLVPPLHYSTFSKQTRKEIEQYAVKIPYPKYAPI
jgi:hypothetical protein